MPNCICCGLPIPEGQGSSCSMCYGDIAHGSDGYYQQWAEQQDKQQQDKQQEHNNLSYLSDLPF